MSILRRIAAGGAGWWRSIPLNTRGRAVLVAVTVPVAAFLMLDATQGPRQFAVLYAGLTEAESVAVCTALETRRVPFELNNGGRTILAPVGQCAELRVEFDQRVLPRVRFMVRINSALNGEVEALRGVSSSGLQDHFVTAQDYYMRGAAG